MMKWEDYRKGEDITIHPRYAKANIECPSCGEEIYEDLSVEYLGCQIQHDFYCFKCGWSGRK